MRTVSVDPTVAHMYRPRSGSPAMWHRHDWSTDLFYRRLVLEMAAHIFAPPTPSLLPLFLYQREPNLRVHRPGDVAVPWHTDAEFGHLPEEWNVWIPLTETIDDCQRLWIEEENGKATPIRVPLDSAYIFRGAQVRHGNFKNITGATRVSFDFRLIAKEHYRDTGARTVLYDVPLRVPEYWSEM